MRGFIAAIVLVFALIGCSGLPSPEIKKLSTDEETSKIGADDWPMWRGPNADGVAVSSSVPTKWSETENVVWKTAIPGRGHSSPVLVGDAIYLETADEEAKVQSVRCISRRNGQLIWQTPLFRENFDPDLHAENTHASSTVASDGERAYAVFLNDHKVCATALNLNGQVAWQVEAGGFRSKFGYSASPTLYKSLVLLAVDHWDGGYVTVLNRHDGTIV